jgi:CubicO group peptidase (beta-lactamase class C family)
MEVNYIMLTETEQIICQEIDLQGPGVAVAIVKDGKPMHIEGYGIANLEWNCPIRPNTVFRLGSITKQFTATAFMLLERQGKLRLGDAITTYLPDYPTHGRTITLTHLLNHTSGIKSYTSLDNFMSDILKQAQSPRDLLAYFKDLPLEFEPGTHFQYNNSGYILLGLILEKITGISYEQCIQQLIFQPLHMNHSYYMHNETIIPHRASGYVKTKESYRQADYLNMVIPYAAGALGSTVEDLIRWDAALFEGQLLDINAQERMYSPTQLGNGRIEEYGFGCGTTTYLGHRLIHHPGDIPGFRTFIARFIDDAAMIAVLANMQEIAVEKIVRKIAHVIFAIPPVTRTPITLDTALLDKAVGTYETEEGFPVVVERDEDKLALRSPFEYSLRPMNENVYYAGQDDEFEVHFADEYAGLFNTIIGHIPISPAFKAMRKQR